ncbi:MAG TPA: ABC transporter substrate-binding protein, partial [Beijerinckiaceae bacterium]|nr:ABC transporter substrate-binding protein [Beijerinckiaceae bacterium]
MRRMIVRGASAILFGGCLLAASAAAAADKVSIAIIGGASDVGFYVADAKGWFHDEGIEVEMTPFDSGARMIAPLSTGELDVGSGALAAGLYNAFERDITMHVVADKGRNTKAISFQGLVVRKALLDGGAIKGLADFKGHKIAFTAPGANDSAVMDEALRKVGLSYNDVDPVFLGLPQQIAGFANGAIDASIMPEPFLSAVIKAGSAAQLAPVASLRDNDQVGVVIYSDVFTKKRPEVAKKLMRAYLRGVRYYDGAIKDGKLAGPNAQEVIDDIAKYSSLHDPALIASIIPSA